MLIQLSCISRLLLESSAALPQKTWAMSGSALAPDVRRWLCPADIREIISGAMPWSGLSPSDLFGQRPHQGHSPKNVIGPSRRGIATASHRAAKPKPHQRGTFRAKLSSATS
jgi:hypothetical protein